MNAHPQTSHRRRPKPSPAEARHDEVADAEALRAVLSARVEARARELEDIEKCMQCTEAMKCVFAHNSLSTCWGCSEIQGWALALERRLKRHEQGT